MCESTTREEGEFYLRIGVLIRMRSWDVNASHGSIAHAEWAYFILIVLLFDWMSHAWQGSWIHG
jgi:hypothetical protein